MGGSTLRRGSKDYEQLAFSFISQFFCNMVTENEYVSEKNRGAEFLYPLVPKNRQTPMGLGSTEGEEYPTVGRTQLGLLGHSFESVQRLVKNRVWSLVCISYRKKGRDPEGPLDRRAAFCPQIACCDPGAVRPAWVHPEVEPGLCGD